MLRCNVDYASFAAWNPTSGSHGFCSFITRRSYLLTVYLCDVFILAYTYCWNIVPSKLLYFHTLLGTCIASASVIIQGVSMAIVL